MLRALQLCYTMTTCIVTSGGEYSTPFFTSSGIRQGAKSSAKLFIYFIDGLIQSLKANCSPEDVLGDLHSLLHADDTAIVSMSEKLFVKKCNIMIAYFAEHKLSLNIGKSGYMVINGNDSVKTGIQLNSGVLSYVSSYVYLGYIITDTGSLQTDINKHVVSKRSNSTIKFINFCRVNSTAPIWIKFRVLDACVNSVYLYGCEVWGDSNYSKLDTLHRKAIRTALSVRQSVNNEIVYVESGEMPLTYTIKSRQLKFWLKMKDFLETHQDSYLHKLVSLARQKSIPYIKFYDNLVSEYESPSNCATVLRNQFHNSMTCKFNDAIGKDSNSKLGVYKQINPDLSKPVHSDLPEFERAKITRYRCGSHYLEVEKGRFEGKKREERLCRCGEIQTLNHVIMDCTYTNRVPDVSTLHDFFQLDTERIVAHLTDIEKSLNIQRS